MCDCLPSALCTSEPREAQVSSSCVECHPECELQTGGPTCTGPVSPACRDSVLVPQRLAESALSDLSDKGGACQLSLFFR